MLGHLRTIQIHANEPVGKDVEKEQKVTENREVSWETPKCWLFLKVTETSSCVISKTTTHFTQNSKFMSSETKTKAVITLTESHRKQLDNACGSSSNYPVQTCSHANSCIHQAKTMRAPTDGNHVQILENISSRSSKGSNSRMCSTVCAVFVSVDRSRARSSTALTVAGLFIAPNHRN